MLTVPMQLSPKRAGRRRTRVMGAGLVSAGVGVALGGMLALGLSPVSPTSAQAADPEPPFPVLSLGSLPALPSVSPVAGLGAGGGGVAGEAWSLVGLPGALGADDPGVSVDEVPVLSARGPVVRLTSVPGRAPYRFVVTDPSKDLGDPSAVVWDSGVVAASNDVCVVAADQAACTIPVSGVGFVNGYAGLRAGGTFRLVTSVGVGGDDEQTFSPRMFSVGVDPAVAGPVGLSVNSAVFNSGSGGFGLGLEFSTGLIGAVPGTAATDGLTPGLPPGWSVSGVPGGHTRVSVVDAQGFQGQDSLLRVASDSGVSFLGCVQAGDGLTCAGLDGSGASLAPTAVVAADGSVQVTDAGSSTVTGFDSRGRLVSVSRPFEPSVQVVYDEADRIDSVRWSHVSYDLFYAGDGQCAQVVPPGFVKTPAGSLCGWRASTDEGFSPGWLRVLYTQPDGAQVPRISRVMGLPADCPADFSGCEVSASDVHDVGWDDHNRPAAFRDPGRSLAVLEGVIGADDLSAVTLYTYDELGRMASVTQPGISDGSRARMSVAYGPADARLAPATRQVSTTLDDTAGAVPARVSVAAFDESARQVFTVSPVGEVTGSTFEPGAAGKGVAAFTGGVLTESGVDWSRGSGISYTADAFDRVVSKSQSKASNFDAERCLPNGAAREYGACAPGDPDGRSVLTGTTSYDAAGVGQGLIAHWFDSTDFSGNVAATTVVDQADSSAPAPGFAITPPGGVGDDGLWSVRLSGSVVLDQPVVYGIEVGVTQGLVSDGVVIVDGSTICTAIASTLQSCTYDNTEANPTASTDAAHAFRIDLSSDGSAKTPTGEVLVRLSAGAAAPVVSGAPFRQRYSAVTASTSSDAYPVAAGGQVATWTTEHAYADALSKGPSSSTAPRLAGASARTATFTTEADPLGAARPTSMVMPSGASRTTTYWGADETPAGAGLAHLDELPGGLQDLPQRGLPKTVTDAGARTVTTVYDPLGRASCTLIDGGHWQCSTYDALARPAGVHIHGAEADVVAEYSYAFDPTRPDLPVVETVTRSTLRHGGHLGDVETDLVTTVTRSSVSGDVVEYTDASEAVTTTRYDVAGRVVSEQIRLPGDNPVTSTRTATYLPNGLLASIARDGTTVATVRYNPTRAWVITGYDYNLGGGIKADIADDDDPTSHQITWTLADGSTLTDAMTTTAAGRLLAETFGATSYAYSYDVNDRLAKATIGGTDYTYSWNTDGLRTCAAEGIANPDNAPCESLPGAHTYTYTDQRLTTTTDPAAAPGGNPSTPFPYDDQGNLTATGDVTLAYTPTGKVDTITSPASTTSYTHDPFERALSETTTTSPTGDTTATITYAYTSPTGGPAAWSTNGATTLIDTLPGGLVRTGTTMAITTGQGHIGQWLTAEGTPDPTRPAVAYTPFGNGNQTLGRTPEGVPTPGWKATTTTATGDLINLGARTYLPRLAMFAQPDPQPGGSGAGPYAYVSGDPINYHDLSGYNAELWMNIGIGLLGMALAGVGTFALSAGIMGRLDGAFWATTRGRVIAHTITAVADTIVSAGVFIAQDAIANNGHVNLSDLTNTVTGAVLGGLTAISAITGHISGAKYIAKQETRASTIATQELRNEGRQSLLSLGGRADKYETIGEITNLQYEIDQLRGRIQINEEYFAPVLEANVERITESNVQQKFNAPRVDPMAGKAVQPQGEFFPNFNSVEPNRQMQRQRFGQFGELTGQR